MQLFSKTNIDFLSKRGTLVWLSLVLNIIGIVAPFALGLRFGIDFAGGTEIAVQLNASNKVGEIRTAIEEANLTGAEIKSYGADNQYLIRIPATSYANDPTPAVVDAIKKAIPGESVNLLKKDSIGPKVGEELRNKAVLAVILAVLAIGIYIAFRFEFLYGVGAAIALLHDVLVTLAMVTVFSSLGIINLEINQAMIAAFLTVVGFSVNDTVIIFDRIRENRELHKGMNLIKLMNLSINETLSRTVNTVMTVVLVLLTLVLLGGEVLQGFAFTMLVGIVTGAYSSIYIASSFVVWFMEKVQHKDLQIEFDRQKATAKA
ncbi:MAG: protein translocase subunit SecF [Bacteroidota bacterium]|jgi:preprotein translocase subunit SecF